MDGKHTYNWTKKILVMMETIEDLIEYSKLEQAGIKEADICYYTITCWKGTHIELGMALALNKKYFYVLKLKMNLGIENTVNFYQLPNIIRLVGTAEENIKEIINL